MKEFAMFVSTRSIRAVLVTLIGVASIGIGSTTVATATPTRTVSGTFVGKVKGTDFYVAVLAARPKKNGQRPVVVYACDNEAGSMYWFSNTNKGNQIDVAAVIGAGSIEATLARKSVAGSITLEDGTRHPFSARRPKRHGSGVYWAKNTDGSPNIGVIALDDGSQRGASVQAISVQRRIATLDDGRILAVRRFSPRTIEGGGGIGIEGGGGVG
jgi:hypothetical protein